MIKLTRINDKFIYINPDLIESVESAPDTILTLTNGNKISLKDKPEEIVNKTIEYKARIISSSEKLKQE